MAARPRSKQHYWVLAHLSVCYSQLGGRLSTCYSPVRHFTHPPKWIFSYDLHVLGTPPALVLSQDQTLQLKIISGDRSPFQLEKRTHKLIIPLFNFQRTVLTRAGRTNAKDPFSKKPCNPADRRKVSCRKKFPSTLISIGMSRTKMSYCLVFSEQGELLPFLFLPVKRKFYLFYINDEMPFFPFS